VQALKGHEQFNGVFGAATAHGLTDAGMAGFLNNARAVYLSVLTVA
jgi:hypothetical protein